MLLQELLKVSEQLKNEPVLMCLSQSNEEKMKSKNKLLPSFLINSLEIKEHFKKIKGKEN